MSLMKLQSMAEPTILATRKCQTLSSSRRESKQVGSRRVSAWETQVFFRVTQSGEAAANVGRQTSREGRLQSSEAFYCSLVANKRLALNRNGTRTMLENNSYRRNWRRWKFRHNGLRMSESLIKTRRRFPAQEVPTSESMSEEVKLSQFIVKF